MLRLSCLVGANEQPVYNGGWRYYMNIYEYLFLKILLPRQKEFGLGLTLIRTVTDIKTWPGNSAPSRYWMFFRNYGLVNTVCELLFMPPPFEEWWSGIKCYPCPCVRAPVRPSSKFGVRSITFERLHRFNSNLVCWYNIKTQVEFDLGYNPLILDRVMDLL